MSASTTNWHIKCLVDFKSAKHFKKLRWLYSAFVIHKREHEQIHKTSVDIDIFMK